MSTTQQKLNEAIAARHKLLIGTQTVSLSMADGSQLQYTPAQLPALERYIAELRRELAVAAGTATAVPRRITYVVPD